MFYTVTTKQLDAIIQQNRKVDPNRKVRIRRDGIFTPDIRIDLYDCANGILVAAGEEIKITEIEEIVFVGKTREAYEVMKTVL